MYPILILPKDDAEYKFVANLLQRMNIETKLPKPPKPQKRKKKQGILSLAGIWEGRVMDAENLRKEAWQRK